MMYCDAKYGARTIDPFSIPDSDLRRFSWPFTQPGSSDTTQITGWSSRLITFISVENKVYAVVDLAAVETCFESISTFLVVVSLTHSNGRYS